MPNTKVGNMSGDHSPSNQEPRGDGAGHRAEPPRPTWLRLSGSGLELAAITIAMGAIGIWLDRKFQMKTPIWSALLGLIGFSYGIYRFIRIAQSISESERESDRLHRKPTAEQDVKDNKQ